MNSKKPKRMLLSLASGSAAVLSIQTLACNQHTIGEPAQPPGQYCEPLDGSLPDGAARDTCNTSDDFTDASSAADGGDARTVVSAGTVTPPLDGGDAK